MKDICFINGGNKARKSTWLFIRCLDQLIDSSKYNKTYIDISTVNVYKHRNSYEKIRNADSIIITFPLHVQYLPSELMKFLEEFNKYVEVTPKINNRCKVYVLVNCIFPEAKVNMEAIRIIGDFCKSLNLEWRFGVGIGMFGFAGVIRNIPVLNRLNKNIFSAISKIFQDIESKLDNADQNLYVEPRIPRNIFLVIADLKWKISAAKNSPKVRRFIRKSYEN